MSNRKSEAVEAFWLRCKALHNIKADEYHSGPFSDPDMAPYQDLLLDLVAQRKKRATARLAMEFEEHGIAARAPGTYWVVLSAVGNPRHLLRITDVEVKPFDKVEQEFAEREGEGDNSLAYWLKVHRDYFVQQCAVWGVDWRDDILVCCEGFDLVVEHEPDQPSGPLPHTD